MAFRMLDNGDIPGGAFAGTRVATVLAIFKVLDLQVAAISMLDSGPDAWILDVRCYLLLGYGKAETYTC